MNCSCLFFWTLFYLPTTKISFVSEAVQLFTVCVPLQSTLSPLAIHWLLIFNYLCYRLVYMCMCFSQSVKWLGLLLLLLSLLTETTATSLLADRMLLPLSGQVARIRTQSLKSERQTHYTLSLLTSTTAAGAGANSNRDDNNVATCASSINNSIDSTITGG